MKRKYNSLGQTLRVLFSDSVSVRSFKNEVSLQQNLKKPIGLLNFCLLFALFSSLFSNAQVTTNGGSGLASSYPNLATAITALNAATITSPVIITLTGNETAPAGGYRITAQGDATNTIVIQGAASTISTNADLVVGSLNDAIIKLVGADFVTIRNFTLQENAANTINTPVESNNMTEWGIAILYLTTTNGAQNNTIQGNTISLNRTYRNSFGIYSNSSHSETAVTAIATATGATGSNTGLSLLSNNITNVNLGIAVVGPNTAADYNQTLTIGGAGFGNTITNFGTDVQLSNFANVSGTGYGILVRNTANYNISYNTIISSNGGFVPASTSTSTLRGIYVPSFSNAPVGTLTQIINHNSISLQPGYAAVQIQGINVEATTGNSTTSLSISNNNINNTKHTVPATGGFFGINVGNANLATNINSNTFTNLNFNTSGSIRFISYNVARPANAVTNVNNNAIVGTFTKNGGSGDITFYHSSSITSPNSAIETNTGNNFSNITVFGTGNIDGWKCTDGGASFPFGPSKTITNNVFSNIVAGGAITVLQVHGANATTINLVANNTISNISGGSTVTGISCQLKGSERIENNTVSGLVSIGSCTVSAIAVSSVVGSTIDVFKNKIYNLEVTNAEASVNGILIGGGDVITIQNNIIGDLRTPNANASNPLKGISITSAGANNIINIFHNTVLLNSSSVGGTFGSSALSVETETATVNLKNNILVNNSIAKGNGLAASFRYVSSDLSNYATTSNNNLFFASAIFTDGTNTDTTLASYKTRVVPRDTDSVSENPTFISTTGSNVNFLHIDTTVPTWIESRAVPINGIAYDFDSEARNVSNSDIGADEFSGICITTSTNTTISTCDLYTWTVNGTTYTSSGTYSHVVGCHTEKLNLTITFATISGETTQIIDGGVDSDVTVEDIEVASNGMVTWYDSFADAEANINPLSAGTILVDGNTYYGVTNIGSCRSMVLGVTVTVVLGNQSFDLNELSYYPNPVSEAFNVRYNKNITSVEIFDLLGIMVKSIQSNTSMVEINLSDLSSAIYIVKLQSEDSKRVKIRIIKK